MNKNDATVVCGQGFIIKACATAFEHIEKISENNVLWKALGYDIKQRVSWSCAQWETHFSLHLLHFDSFPKYESLVEKTKKKKKEKTGRYSFASSCVLFVYLRLDSNKQKTADVVSELHSRLHFFGTGTLGCVSAGGSAGKHSFGLKWKDPFKCGLLL